MADLAIENFPNFRLWGEGFTYLNVPFSRRDEAKALGAMFDGILKRWYIPPGLKYL